ncbi:DUF6431 domain-containing protein [Cohnella sp. 56]|uniref:DUF6431 domain-containing protein n=1 Tax=Cohnella sp. 56 TaxID=3113722 RepID=UPI00404027C0
MYSNIACNNCIECLHTCFVKTFILGDIFYLYGTQSPAVKLSCEDCGCCLHKYGRYIRAIATKSEIVQNPIYRQLCPVCGRTISILPDFLVPWARYTTWIRESAILDGRTASLGAKRQSAPSPHPSVAADGL